MDLRRRHIELLVGPSDYGEIGLLFIKELIRKVIRRKYFITFCKLEGKECSKSTNLNVLSNSYIDEGSSTHSYDEVLTTNLL